MVAVPRNLVPRHIMTLHSRVRDVGLEAEGATPRHLLLRPGRRNGPRVIARSPVLRRQLERKTKRGNAVARMIVDVRKLRQPIQLLRLGRWSLVDARIQIDEVNARL